MNLGEFCLNQSRDDAAWSPEKFIRNEKRVATLGCPFVVDLMYKLRRAETTRPCEMYNNIRTQVLN